MFEFAAMLFKFLGGDVAKTMLQAYQQHLTATTTDKQTAAKLAGQEIAARVAETQAITQYRIAEIGHPWEPDKIMGYLVAVLLGKLIVWDICLGLGTTDLHSGWVTGTANTNIMFYFGKRGAENIFRILKS